MTDWNKFDNAVEASVLYRDSFGKTVAQRLVKRPTQTKTVADAVEYYNGEFPEGRAVLGIAYSNNKIVPYYAGSPIADGTNSTESYIICTREQFEACVKEKEDSKITMEDINEHLESGEQECEKWTHTYLGENCYVVHVDGCAAWVVVQNAGGKIITTNSLKPIKPTISEAELLNKIKDMGKGLASNAHFGDTVRGWLDNYDII